MSDSTPKPMSDVDQSEVLERWVAALADELLGSRASAETRAELVSQIDSILALAGTAARSVIRPAAPLTTFVVGYAAGLAARDASKPDQAEAAASSTVAGTSDVSAPSTFAQPIAAANAFADGWQADGSDELPTP
ncbi:DUF6457 domain-containing protein [Subtercola lobariae]|uniref:DUF6457 domain-containing protein n=1 Tax=Subtercola lobariae TaxID=1588641 RepID=A0A917B070_9MICO|nr:DUF6457 domain-containing protein [Subtercola lobariae]GGF10827.1 hypothetical protein GCM10011399_00810 [Subtercola lobariae]